DRGTRRRADAAGARARQAARRAGARGRARVAQPPRHLRGRHADHGSSARSQRRRLRAGQDDAAGDRAGHHRRPADEGRRRAGHRSGARHMTDATPDVDIAAPGIGLPEGGEEGTAGWWHVIWDNIRGGNLGVLPIVLGLLLIVVFFTIKTPVFFTANNFNNILVQMAGTCMLAYGVVFVLLLGEIDLSIGYLSGLAAVAVAELQLPGPTSVHAFPFTLIAPVTGLIAIPIAIGIVGAIGAAQGTIVAKIGVPSFVVTLAGYLIWQGAILQILGIQGTVVIQDKWVNDTVNYYLSDLGGWLIAAVITALYAATALAHVVGLRRAGVAIRKPWLLAAKVVGVAIVAFGVVAICNHA